MKRTFQIYDYESEHILSFEGYDFTPEKETLCLFDIDCELGGIDIIARVMDYIYVHNNNELAINCKLIEPLQKHEMEIVIAYNQMINEI